MKFFALILVFLISNISNAQNYSWITPNTPYLKMYVVDDGIYRINKIDFINGGINPNQIDPRTVKVYNKGNQIPIYFYGEQDGVFNDSDYFDFSGSRNYGGLTITYQELNSNTVPAYTTNEYYDQYSDTNVYWVNWGGSFGLRYSIYNVGSSTPFPQSFFYSKIQFEKDRYFSLGEHSNSNDFRNFNTEKIMGEGWYWKEMSKNDILFDTFSIPSLNSSNQLCSLKLFAYPESFSSTYTYEHRLIIKVNSILIDTIFSNHYDRVDTTLTFPSNLLQAGSVNQISVTYSNPFLYAGKMLFDYFTLYYPKKFNFESNQTNYNTTIPDTSSRIFKIKYFNPSSEINIYDVKNFNKVDSYQISSDTLIFSGRYNGNFFLVNNYITKKPFRIKQKQVPDLVSTSNGADYLLVYNKIFENQAEQLRLFHQGFDTLRSKKADIEDIYDIFNFGLENPVALRKFVKYAYFNWQLPKLRFLCLFGRGSLDPKNNLNNSFYHNFVPVYGNPPSDGYFVNFNDYSFTYFHQVATGRIPCYTTDEATNITNKIIGFPSQPLNRWIKNAIFITGGSNLLEQIDFANKSNYFINTYTFPCPVSFFPIRIYRNDSIGYVTFNYQDSIRLSINRGASIVNYIGHAGNETWENGIEDPDILNNGNRLPLVFSMTCFTGKNAETDFRSFGEKFYYLPNKGALGFVGTTGWSFSSSGNTLNDYILRAFTKDSLRYIGEIMKKGIFYMVPDSASYTTKNTIKCYNMIGDTASRILVPTNPEFDIQLSDYELSNLYPSLRENIILKIYPINLGTCSDSLKVRYKLIKNNQNFQTRDTVIYNFSLYDTVLYNFHIDSSGNYSMVVTLDPDNWYPKDLKSNNQISFPLLLKNISFVPLKPVDNILLNSDSVKFLGLNPNIPPTGNNVRLLVQIDTSVSFKSGLLQTFFKDNPSGVVTNFKAGIPILDSNLVYFWRMNSVINGDSSGWSEVRKFTVNIQQKINEKLRGKFLQNTNSNDSIITVSKKKYVQYSPTDLLNVTSDSNGLSLGKIQSLMKVRSFGTNGFEASYFIIGNRTIFIDGGNNPVLNMVKVNRITGSILDFKNFMMSTSSSSDSVLNFLNTFDTSQYLMALNASFPTLMNPFNDLTKLKLRTFGSVYADSLPGLGFFHTWSFIGFIGANSSQVSEQFHRYAGQWIESISQITTYFFSPSGTVSNLIIPTTKWFNFGWQQIIYPFANLKFDVYGIDRNNQQQLLLPNLTNNFVSLDTISTETYPGLLLKTTMSIDTVNGRKLPTLKSFNINYQPGCEIVPDNNSFFKSDSTVLEGDSITFRINVYNEGYSTAKIVISNWSASSPSGNRLLKSDTNNVFLTPGNFFTTQIRFNTTGLRNPQKVQDTIYLFYEAKLNQKENEFYTYNNNAVSKFIITGDTLKPILDVTYDGTKLQSGDFVQSKPQILLKFFDNSHIVIKDTSNIKVKLDDSLVPYYINGIKNPDIDFMLTGGKGYFQQASVLFKPVLVAGDHKFEYFAYDNNGNKADTIRNILTVQNDLKIFDLYNYPNPMRSATSFLFKLSGSTPPSRSRIRIYTVAGRMIKEILFTATVGYNVIEWDGRDSDGDNIANGVYLYKLLIEGDSKKESSIQKLVVLK